MGALRMGVTGGVMRRCAWRLGRWGAGYGVGRKEVRAWARVVLGWVTPREVLVNGVVRIGNGGVEDGRDGRRHASVRVEARSVGGRLGRWEEGGV
ncbi:hypothetical protein KY284_000961 [Solanum tuberosum]|nr:hypothetical protein KY284_000961 [Solanum tuberosum]